VDDQPHPAPDRRFRLAAQQPVRRSVPVPAGFPLEASAKAVREAVDDLAGRLGVDLAAIRLVEARAVTWGDSSCGCPQQGMNYLQRLVDGAWVLLEVDGRRYDYRGGATMRRCHEAEDVPPPDATRAGRAPDHRGPDPL